MSEQKFKETSCACNICVKMCKTRPCWPTPEEAERLIDEGFGDKLMKDYWVGSDDDINIISPAIVGYEKHTAPFVPTGRCTLLTKDNRCLLHEIGMKPLEGRVAYHGNETDIDIHEYVAMLWNSKIGRRVTKKWKRLINNGE